MQNFLRYYSRHIGNEEPEAESCVIFLKATEKVGE